MVQSHGRIIGLRLRLAIDLLSGSKKKHNVVRKRIVSELTPVLDEDVTTIDEEDKNMLPFLDVLVSKVPSSFLSTLYTKPTFMGLYISEDSFTVRSRKMNLVKCHTHRELMIRSNCRVEAELKKVTKFIF